MKNTNIPSWDLGDLYVNIDDTKIEKDKRNLTLWTKKFTSTYKSKINSKKLTVNSLLKALNDYEKILDKLYKLVIYSNLFFTTNTKDDKIKGFYQKVHEFMTNIDSETLWFNLEWIELDNKTANSLIKNPKLTKYKHFLFQTRILKPFTLSEKEEQIMNMKSQTSRSAFMRLYDQTESTEKFEITIKGKSQILNNSAIGSIMKSNPDRAIREKASNVYSKTYGSNSNLYVFILNTLLLDKKITDEIRKFNYPQEATFLGYEIEKVTVENMIQTVSRNSKLVERFYLAKKKFLKVKDLHEWDRYSSIFNANEKESVYSWEEATQIVLDCFMDFSPAFHDIAKLFFDNKWIDAKVTDGKRSGAYCQLGLPSYHPMVFVNFSGKVEDITTLAHELGHAIHAYLSKGNTLLEFDPSTAIAEMASTFAESLVFEKLYNLTKNKNEKINLLATKIQNNFATVFRQNDFYLFETKLHELRRSEGELTKDEISNLYQETLQKTFGKGLTLTSLHENFWMPISHFYHYNFYVFTYVFGELLALSVYGKFKRGEKGFVEKYTKALSTGGTLNPYELAKIIDIDLNDKNFWQKGIDLIEEEVREFEKVVS